MQRKKIIVGVLFFIILVFHLKAENFVRVDQWKHEGVVGYVFCSFINAENQVVASFYKSPNFIIQRDKLIEFAPYGQGPNDLMDTKAGFNYNGDVAFIELADKIKIFTKKEDGTYAWKETKWLKRGQYAHMVRDGIYFDHKWFLAGEELLDYKNNIAGVSYVKVFDDNGKPLKQLIHEEYKQPNQFHLMRFYLVPYKDDRVFFLPENELKVSVISAKKLEVSKEVELEIPSFYKKMPDTFYVFKKYNNAQENFTLDLENWAMGYSRITKVVMNGDSLVVQLRTCRADMKKFALLFYSAETFKLERTVFIDDFLLGARADKFYFFANGNPGRDEDTEEIVINVYAFEKKK